MSEKNLSEALNNIENKKEYETAKILLEKVSILNYESFQKLILFIRSISKKAQKKFEQVKHESLKTLNSPKSSKEFVT